MLDADAIGVAAPVRDPAGAVTAVISVVALASRAAGEQADALIAHVRRSADTLTSQLALAAN